MPNSAFMHSRSSIKCQLFAIQMLVLIQGPCAVWQDQRKRGSRGMDFSVLFQGEGGLLRSFMRRLLAGAWCDGMLVLVTWLSTMPLGCRWRNHSFRLFTPFPVLVVRERNLRLRSGWLSAQIRKVQMGKIPPSFWFPLRSLKDLKEMVRNKEQCESLLV